MGRLAIGVLITLTLAIGGAYLWVGQTNSYRTDGTLTLAVLSEPVTVTRDARGVAHIAAGNRRDMLRAQGFITAQDRLFQMEFFRMLAWGRLAELIGEDGIDSDTAMRVFGLPQNARKMAAQFAPDVEQYLQDYLDGVNAYLSTQQQEFPLELSILGHSPEPWTLEDSAIVLQYISLQHSVNMQAEALSLALLQALGAKRASSLMPINANPERTPEYLEAMFVDPLSQMAQPRSDTASPSDDSNTALLRPVGPVLPNYAYAQVAPLHLGSNNWVAGPDRSTSGSAMVVNDPHLDSRLLPGVWYPIGMSTGDFHATGVALPAIPGIVVGRTNRVAFGVTNAYGDVQDLFLEREDPESSDYYLEGETRVAFDTRREVIRIKDDAAAGGFREQSITIRSTRRGPVVSDHGIVDLGDQIVSLRWGATVNFGPEIGYDKIFYAQTAAEVDAGAQLMDINMFNYVFADMDGNFGRRATGKIPNRRVGEGVIPVAVTDAGPYWTSFIPKDQLPGEFNPTRGWTGTANHDTRPDNYAHTYSTYFSPSYRYRRLMQLMESKQKISAADHWTFMHDAQNLQAEVMVPLLDSRLRAAGYPEIADLLAAWSKEDSAGERAPLVYQVLYRELAIATFQDELGSILTGELLNNWYYWQERFDQMVAEGNSDWFDNTETQGVETLDDIVATAAEEATEQLTAYAPDATWGDAHRITFTSPMRRSGFGSEWVGGGDYPMSGSGATLWRARYGFTEPFATVFFASFNMVSDMAETEEIVTALPGGVAARVFHEHYASQIRDWHTQLATPTPLSKQAAQTAARHTLTLTP
ncbi:MAG: penicillin acylase family protein [Pseudomonadota bacterium]